MSTKNTQNNDFTDELDTSNIDNQSLTGILDMEDTVSNTSEQDIYRMTQDEHDHLQHELHAAYEELRTQKDARDTARGFGDLRENAEYSDACAQITKLNQTIESIEQRLSHCEIISTQRGLVDIGASVTFTDSLDGLVSEANILIVGKGNGGLPNKCSVDSIFGAAILGRRVGNTFTYMDNKSRLHTITITGIK